ncbi:kinase-like domain-containing protein [Hygrophoropsis aurantiaca]|uniref:Kinase-like domain-containing protein n=1 Tax=Hygrophoropsis aurantiaca TaxID=72124 RepID=A0ACB8A8G4_9AGAM|nr:kinase-like domain-containing protein [Hygrophoropsis aurantiaca]
MPIVIPVELPDLTGLIKRIDQYDMGHGNSADLWKGEYTKDGRTISVAIKAIRNVNTDAEVERLSAKLIREARVWSQLVHPNISRFLGICYELAYKSTQPCLISPYYKNRDSFTYLQENPSVPRIPLLQQIAAGLEHLHKRLIVHGDLKAKNVLINDKGEACLTDFGLSRIVDLSGFTTKNLSAGTTRWMAYELLVVYKKEDLQPSELPRPTPASDVWAFGMTALEVYGGQRPFIEERADGQVMIRIIDKGLPTQESQGFKDAQVLWDTLKKCWTHDPAERVTIEKMREYLADLP